jgi:hypothetical protein
MPNFSKLQEHADKLSALLKNREMGRASWTMFVGEHWKAIADMWTSQKNEIKGQKSITPERAKELEGVAVVYGVGLTESQVGITRGVLIDVGPNCFDKSGTTALLIVDATVADLAEHRRNFDTLLVLDWKTIFEHKEDARAYAVNILKKRIDAINEEIEGYDWEDIMVGIHGVKIYTEGDNPWCETCLNGERIVGEFLYKEGAYICHCKSIPTEEGCTEYVEKKPEE